MEPSSHQEGRIADRKAWPLAVEVRASPPHQPTLAATCSSQPVAPAVSCAPAGAARTAAGRRARCRPAWTPRSCRCTQGGAAAPTCGPAFPWPSRRRTTTRTRKEAMERGRRRNGEKEGTGRGDQPHLLQRHWRDWAAAAAWGSRRLLPATPARTATCRRAPEDLRVP